MALPSASLGLFSLGWSKIERAKGKVPTYQYTPYHLLQLKNNQKTFQYFNMAWLSVTT
jgi:hypothetical protein